MIAAAISMCPFGPSLAASSASQYYEDALAKYRDGDMSGTVIQLKNALQLDSKLLQAHLLLGKALLARSEVAAAEAALTEALNLGVNRAEVVLSLARAVADQGRPREVIERPLFALDGLPRDIRLSLVLAKASAASDLGENGEAMRWLEQAKGMAGSTAQVLAAEVPLRIRAGQIKESVEVARRAVQASPDDASAQYALASAWHAAGNAGEARNAYDTAVRLDPKHLEARVGRAGVWMDLGEVAKAEEDLRVVREIQPKEPRAAYFGALIAERRGDKAAAKAALTELTGLLDVVPPDYLRYRSQLSMLGGLAHYGLGQYEKAKPYLIAVQRQVGNLAASKLLADIFIREGNVDGAINALEPYVRAVPTDESAVELLAQAHAGAGRALRAVQVIQNALDVRESATLRTALGLALIRAGKKREALAELEAALRADRNQLKATAALAELYADTGDTAKALRLAAQLLAREPKNPAVLDLVGNVRMRAGDRTGARQALEAALKLRPESRATLLSIARLERAERRFEAAERAVGSVLSRSPDDIEAMLESALLADRRGDNTSALARYTKAADKAAPTDLRPALALTGFLLKRGQFEEAQKAASRFAGAVETNLQAAVATARVQLANRDATAARRTLSRATTLAQYEANSQVEIAALQLLADNIAGARYSVEKALTIEPDNIPANSVLVDVLIGERNYAEAQKRARKVSASAPRRALGPTLEAKVAIAGGTWPEAADLLRTAHRLEPGTSTAVAAHDAYLRADPAAGRALMESWLKSHPDDLAAWHAYGDGLARESRLAEARRAYESIIARASDDARALNNLANVLIKLKDPGALALAERAYKLRPQHAPTIDTLAWAAFHVGQHDRALQLLRDARLRSPGSAEIRYHLAATLVALGRNVEARTELEAALRSGTDFGEADAARDLLRSLP